MTKRTVRAALLAAVAAAGIGTAAIAYWSEPGAGAASVSTGNLDIEVEAIAGGDAPEAQLAPGGTGEVILRIRNPNAFSVELVTVEEIGPAIVDAAPEACAVPDVGLVAPVASVVPAIVLEPGSTLVRLPDAVEMGTSSSSGCQGATFELPVRVTVKR